MDVVALLEQFADRGMCGEQRVVRARHAAHLWLGRKLHVRSI
jgi:hypothetical protein